jgi:hypothetical protein
MPLRPHHWPWVKAQATDPKKPKPKRKTPARTQICGRCREAFEISPGTPKVYCSPFCTQRARDAARTRRCRLCGATFLAPKPSSAQTVCVIHDAATTEDLNVEQLKHGAGAVSPAGGGLHSGFIQQQGDRFAPGVFADLFRQKGIDYTISERDTSAQFIELLALVNSGTVELLDDDVLLAQLRGLERRTRPGGHDRVSESSRGSQVCTRPPDSVSLQTSHRAWRARTRG